MQFYPIGNAIQQSKQQGPGVVFDAGRPGAAGKACINAETNAPFAQARTSETTWSQCLRNRSGEKSIARLLAPSAISL